MYEYYNLILDTCSKAVSEYSDGTKAIDEPDEHVCHNLAKLFTSYIKL